MTEPITATVTIKSGDDSHQREHSVKFELWRTSAPPRYDHAHTITMYDDHGPNKERQRYVLLPADTRAWHQGRYGSGLYSCEPEDDAMLAKSAADLFWQRLEGKGEPSTEPSSTSQTSRSCEPQTISTRRKRRP